jgi:tetrahydromethanopterin S-methyltransferase subunit E
MPYSHFKTLSSAIDTFDLELHEGPFFPTLQPIEPSDTLRIAIEDSLPTVAASSEKARSEGLIYPVLMETRRILNKQVSLFSGEEFAVDEAAGLTGIVDFLMSRSPQISAIQAPAIVVVEAKKADLRSGFGQCVAEMVAADRFNHRKGKAIHHVYGIVTSGTQWRFLQLQNTLLKMDLLDYPLMPIDRLLAQLSWILREG